MTRKERTIGNTELSWLRSLVAYTRMRFLVQTLRSNTFPYPTFSTTQSSSKNPSIIYPFQEHNPRAPKSPVLRTYLPRANNDTERHRTENLTRTRQQTKHKTHETHETQKHNTTHNTKRQTDRQTREKTIHRNTIETKTWITRELRELEKAVSTNVWIRGWSKFDPP